MGVSPPWTGGRPGWANSVGGVCAVVVVVAVAAAASEAVGPDLVDGAWSRYLVKLAGWIAVGGQDDHV